MNDSTRHMATLLMESHGLAPNVRSNSFSSTQVWSKLYQAGSYFVDLNLSPGLQGLTLQGEMMIEDEALLPREGIVTLHNHAGEIVASAPLGDASAIGKGVFVFDIEQAHDYHLEVMFDQNVLSIAGIEVR